MRVAFRVDASAIIGTGHLVRCLTLADALSGAGNECQFIIRDHPSAPVELIQSRGFPCSVLSLSSNPPDGELAHSSWLGAPQDDDAKQSLAAIGGKVDWLVVDHYALDHRWHAAMRKSASKILVIDDIADRRHDCDVLLDQNLQGRNDRYNGLTPLHSRHLLGPHYALLHPKFAELHQKLGEGRRDGAILVYFGGVDGDGATLAALEAVTRAGISDQTIDIVVGANNPHLDAISKASSRLENARLYQGAADMALLMAGASIAIGAAGATTWERCCLALPTILVTIAENQKPGAEAIAREGAALWIGDLGEDAAGRIASALQTLLCAPHLTDVISRRAYDLVDGKGAERVVRAMQEISINLRLARPEDCDRILEWRNDERTLRHSRDDHPVEIEDHRRWFAATLSNPNRALLIGESDGEPVGVVRYDRNGENAVISVYLVPGRAGRGEGQRLIKSGSKWVEANWPDVRMIEAEVLEANKASSTAFIAAGYCRFISTYRYFPTERTNS